MILALFLLWWPPLYAQQPSTGIFSQLKDVTQYHKNLLKKRFEQAPRLKGEKLKALKDYSLAPSFIRSMALHSPHQYLSLATSNPCSVYDLLVNQLLRADSEFADLVAMKAPTQEEFSISMDDFKEHLFKRDCPQEYEKLQFFQAKALKSFLQSLQFKSPRSDTQCKREFTSWTTNPYLPNLCALTDIKRQMSVLMKRRSSLSPTDIDQLKRINGILGLKRQSLAAVSRDIQTYLSNLCSNIDDQEKFCKLYVSPHVWRKVLLKERPRFIMDYRCPDFTKSPKLSTCHVEILKEKDACHIGGVKKFPSLIPRESCSSQSMALNASRLVTRYRDCPARIDESIIMNVHRIYAHFKKNENQGNDCQSFALSNFAQLNQDNPEAWPMKICYFNKIERKEICKSFIPGGPENIADPYKQMAETNVIARIIPRITPSLPRVTCKMIHSRAYKTGRLTYRSGCFITSDFTNCTLRKCPRKIFLDRKEIKEISYKGRFNLHYFDDSFINPNNSQIRILENVGKIDSTKLPNFTIVKSFFDRNPENIIHGIGCLEYLMPKMFPVTQINQCTPEAFIVDGFLEENDEKFLVVRAGIDDIHSPRSIWWHNVFQSVISYQKLHPTRAWALYGSSKRANFQ